MADYKINFKDLKQRVGVDDVAYALGYRLDKKAGVGRYVELVLGDGNAKRDTIVICNLRDKASQTFFRRNGSSGDVITLIKENLNSFNVQGKNDWQKVANVMAKFANMPEISNDDKIYTRKAQTPAEFDINRFDIKAANTDKLPYILAQRGITLDTFNTFKEFICFIKDKQNERFGGYNVGFPYSQSADSSIEGFEVRGIKGFKGKAAGSNSSSAAWIADINSKREGVEHVYFFESAFDAMAYYQANKVAVQHQNAAFISLGGTFSDMQVENVLKQFPNATLHDCFDNDTMGKIYGIRMAAIAENRDLSISKKGNTYSLKVNDKCFELSEDKLSLTEYYKNTGNSYLVKNSKAPADFKDWNDVVLGKKSEVVLPVSKHERNRNLADSRCKSIKI